MINIGIAGIGFVGNAIYNFFKDKENTICYDKYKDLNKKEELLDTNILFLALPTIYNEEIKEYDKSAIYEVSNFLNENKYNGIVIIKSTVEPGTTDKLSHMFKNLKICHNPEFLTARSAVEDFNNQNHIVIGKGLNCKDEDIEFIKNLYLKYFKKSEISLCKSLESESMKIMCNSFYASKIMIFNEYYLLCQKNGSDFKKILELMLKNNWINPMHTNIPGPDGLMAYGGACFPKDTQALNKYMESYKSENSVLLSVIKECNLLRKE